MARSTTRHHDGKRSSAERWARWQFVATVIRVVVEIIDMIDHGGTGPGRLL
jgi:hypothetical protein